MTDLCPTTGKPKLSAPAAQEQARRSRRTFQVARCRACGRWHVNSVTFLSRAIRKADRQAREKRQRPIIDDEDS